MKGNYSRFPGSSSSAHSLREHQPRVGDDASVGRMAGLLERGSTVLRRFKGGQSPSPPAQCLPYRSPSGSRWYASDDESNASGGDDTDDVSNSSITSSVYVAPSVAPLARDVLRGILLLVMEMDGGLQRVPTLSLVCRYWNAVMSEQVVWGRVAQLFVPSLPLICILRDAPTQYTFHSEAKAAAAALQPRPVPKEDEVAVRGRRRHRHRRTTSSVTEGEAERRPSSSMPSRVSSPVTARSLKSSYYGPRNLSRSSSFEEGFYEDADNHSGPPTQAASRTASMASESSAGRHALSSIFSEGGGLLADAAAAVAAVSRLDQPQYLTRTLPTKDMVHVVLAGLKSYREQRILQKMVARRRRFVLQCWGSGGLFFFTSFVGSGMCALEHWDPITMCNRHVSFSFLYMSFACIFGMGISNVVMETHFEPLAFFPRLERQRELIAASAMALFGVLICVAWPTYWAQQNVDHIGSVLHLREVSEGSDISAGVGIDSMGGIQADKPYSWFQVAMPVLCALLAWQVEVVIAQRRQIAEWFVEHVTVRSWRVTSAKEVTRRVFSWLLAVVSHGVPLQLGVSCIALAQYMEAFTPGLLLVALGPTMFVIAVLMCVLLVDYDRRGQFIDGAAAASLGLLLSTGIWLLVVEEARGLCLMPMFLASLGFLWCQLQTLLQVVDEAIIGAEMVGLDG